MSEAIYLLYFIFFLPTYLAANQNEDLRPILRDTTHTKIRPVPFYIDSDGLEFTAEQDSAYYRALNLRIPSETRIRLALMETEFQWHLYRQLGKGMPLSMAYANVMNLPSEVFLPRGFQITQRQEMIRKAFEVPFMPGSVPPQFGTFNLEDIASLLGLKEDVSPVIKYNLENPISVEIVIYSTQAKVIATLFDGNQPAGSYRIEWNMKDDNGNRVGSGDYIAEVRIGNERYIRKLVVIK